MASLADLKRAWLLRALGLSSSTLSESALDTLLYSQVNGVAQNKQFKSGRYYGPDLMSAVTAQALTLNLLKCMPFIVGKTTTFDRIAIEVTTAGAGGTVRLGIFSDNNGLPGTLELDAGTVDSSSLGIKEIVINKQLSPGLYWLAAAAQAGVAPSIYCHTSAANPYVGHSAYPSNIGYDSYSLAGVAGALASNPAVSTAAGVSPRVCLRSV